MERGYHVAAVADALFSPGEAHRHGLDRLRAEGVQLLSAKELFYDWARTLADVRALVRDHPSSSRRPASRSRTFYAPASKRACSSTVRSAVGTASRRASGIAAPLSTERP